MLKELKRRAAPMHPAMLVLGAANTTEAICLSYLGQEHLLAYSLVLPLLLLLDAIGLGLGAGAASLYARSDARQRGMIARSSLLWAWITGLLLTSAPLIASSYLAQPVADSYIRFWVPAMPFALVNFCALALLRAADRSRQAGKVIMLSGALQITLTPTLVFGVGIVPAMGISGAALAHTLAAMLVSTVLLPQRWRRLPITGMFSVGRALFALALPAAFANLSVPLGVTMMMTLLGALHDGYVAAFALALRIESFCLVAFYAYSSVIGPLAVAQRQRYPQTFFALLNHCRNHCFALGAGLTVLLASLPFTFPYWLTSCPDAVLPLQLYFWTIPLSYGAHGFVMLANGVFNGLGRPYFGLVISVLRCVVLLWPTAILLNQFWPGHGVFIAIAASNSLSAIAAALLLKRAYTQIPDSASAIIHQPFMRKFYDQTLRAVVCTHQPLFTRRYTETQRRGGNDPETRS